jgi:sortase A
LALVIAAPFLGFLTVNQVARAAWAGHIEGDCLEARAETAEGDCVGVLRIPSLGDDWARPIVKGSGQGVVWVEGTTPAGELGNFVLTGRRLGGGSPFAGAETLDAGAAIIVETPDAVYTYTLDVAPREITVQAGDTWVLDPVPGETELAPQQAVLTLLFRQDLWPTADRSAGFAVLTAAEPR